MSDDIRALTAQLASDPTSLVFLRLGRRCSTPAGWTRRPRSSARVSPGTRICRMATTSTPGSWSSRRTSSRPLTNGTSRCGSIRSMAVPTRDWGTSIIRQASWPPLSTTWKQPPSCVRTMPACGWPWSGCGPGWPSGSRPPEPVWSMCRPRRLSRRNRSPKRGRRRRWGPSPLSPRAAAARSRRERKTPCWWIRPGSGSMAPWPGPATRPTTGWRPNSPAWAGRRRARRGCSIWASGRRSRWRRPRRISWSWLRRPRACCWSGARRPSRWGG